MSSPKLGVCRLQNAITFHFAVAQQRVDFTGTFELPGACLLHPFSHQLTAFSLRFPLTERTRR